MAKRGPRPSPTRPPRPIGLADLERARLLPTFFAGAAVTVARGLIGCALVHRGRAGVIVETEAYLGPDDLASHARFGPTSRTSVMFGPGGVSYVYLCYGIHQMFNIVTGGDGEAQAVLIRAIAPYVGLADDPGVGRGPGKVTQALRLDHRQDRKDLSRGPLFVAAALVPPRVASGPRIGVAYAGAWADEPLRFWWDDHPAVSRTPGRATTRGPVRGTRRGTRRGTTRGTR
jgi:DNA-3-methyladenine glycosylase